MKLFAKVVFGSKPLTIFARNSILDILDIIWLDSEYAMNVRRTSHLNSHYGLLPGYKIQSSPIITRLERKIENFTGCKCYNEILSQTIKQ